MERTEGEKQAFGFLQWRKRYYGDEMFMYDDNVKDPLDDDNDDGMNEEDREHLDNWLWG
jgi:hypothetical protein